MEFLCEEIAPRISSTVLERHPINVVGNALDDSVRRLCERRVGVNAVGWVPSVHPYLNSARVSVVPLLYGAGTKRKLIQALRAGTPTVSTSVGVEGLGVTPGTEVLVADDPRSFAASVERLIDDEALWSRLADAGRNLIEREHGRATTHARFRDAVNEILEREPNVSAPRVPATATRERAPLPDPPCRASRWQSRRARRAASDLHCRLTRLGDERPDLGAGPTPEYPAARRERLAGQARCRRRDLIRACDPSRRPFRIRRDGNLPCLVLLGNGVGGERTDLQSPRAIRERATAPEGSQQLSPADMAARPPDDPKARWIDGTSEYSHSIVPLRRLFPGAVFIHLLRDVREVAPITRSFPHTGGRRFNWQEAYESGSET